MNYSYFKQIIIKFQLKRVLMAIINIFKGTRKPINNTLGNALAELAKYQDVKVSPKLGEIDMIGYRLAHELEKSSMARGRNQVDLDTFVTKFLQRPEIYRRPNTQKIVLLERDIFAGRLNWCFGQYRQQQGINMVLLSTARIANNQHFYDLLTHELGHMYGAARKGRSNTVGNLGSHCINDLCVMQQKTSVDESLRYVQQRHRANASTYCGQCKDDLRK
jgi:predicted Zn-dependent protease